MGQSWAGRRLDCRVSLGCPSRGGLAALVDVALGPRAHDTDVEDPRGARVCTLYVRTNGTYVRSTRVRTYVLIHRVPWYSSTFSTTAHTAVEYHLVGMDHTSY